MKSDRPYVQRQRAEQAAATGTRILDAAVAVFLETGREPPLEEVATRAGVTVQTVLRRYGSKAGLLDAAAARTGDQIAAERGAAPVGDISGAVANLFDHYEAWGTLSLRLLANEGVGPEAQRFAADGRAFHRAWLERVFAPWLGADDGARRVDALVVATDVYTWKLLTRDLGRPRTDAEALVLDLISKILA